VRTSSIQDTALVIMARYPQKGTTKTRLARAIGAEAALELYRAFLADLAHKFCPYNLHWFYSPAWIDYAAFLETLVPALTAPMRFFPQQGEGLGERLHHAFLTTHQQGYRNTVLIGSDTPHIRPAIVSQARAALDYSDVVLGPAEDGGYYLIAMREPFDVFRGIPMSTGQVLSMTIDLARRQGLSVSTLETFFDVDELPDLLRLANLLQVDRELAPETAAHLVSIEERV
jgi:rSAM/selenodomain-associated transferase 1